MVFIASLPEVASDGELSRLDGKLGLLPLISSLLVLVASLHRIVLDGV